MRARDSGPNRQADNPYTGVFKSRLTKAQGLAHRLIPPARRSSTLPAAVINSAPRWTMLNLSVCQATHSLARTEARVKSAHAPVKRRATTRLHSAPSG